MNPLHRNSADFEPGPNDDNEIKSWGLGLGTEIPVTNQHSSASKKVVTYIRPPSGMLKATSKDKLKAAVVQTEKEVLVSLRYFIKTFY